MRCYGNYVDDRICDVCKNTNYQMYSNCLELHKLHKDEINTKNKIKELKYKCKYHTTALDEYDEFDACNKNGHGYGRFADECKPTLDCKKYCKEDTK